MTTFENLVAQHLRAKIKTQMGERWKVTFVDVIEHPDYGFTFESPKKFWVKSFRALLSRHKEVYEVGKLLEPVDEDPESLAGAITKVFCYAMKHPDKFALARK